MVFNGKTSHKVRKDIDFKYNNSEIDVLLISRGGESLNLHNTSELFILDPVWHQAGVDQIIERVLRYQSNPNGSKKDIIVDVYITNMIKPSKVKDIVPSMDIILRDNFIRKKKDLNTNITDNALIPISLQKHTDYKRLRNEAENLTFFSPSKVNNIIINIIIIIQVLRLRSNIDHKILEYVEYEFSNIANINEIVEIVVSLQRSVIIKATNVLLYNKHLMNKTDGSLIEWLNMYIHQSRGVKLGVCTSLIKTMLHYFRPTLSFNDTSDSSLESKSYSSPDITIYQRLNKRSLLLRSDDSDSSSEDSEISSSPDIPITQLVNESSLSFNDAY